MHTPEVRDDGMPNEVFSAGYAEAQRLILEHNDLDAAMECLNVITPESEPTLWRWTDLVAALLLKKGQYGECCRILASYEDRYPGNHPVMAMIQMLREKSPGIDIRAHPSSINEVG